jgi:hypothetical protein
VKPQETRTLGIVLLLAVTFVAQGAVGVAAEKGGSAGPDVSPFERLPDLFPVMPWDTLHSQKPPQPRPEKGLESIAQCHFTLAGFVEPEDLPQCEKLGLLAIMAPKSGKAPSRKLWRNFTDEEIEAYVKSLVGDTAKNPTVLGYYVSDEPSAREFTGLGKAVAALKKLAPGKLAYINLFPSYSTLEASRSRLGTNSYEEYLERFVQEVKPQLISYDNYAVLHSDDLQGAKGAATYLKNLLQIRDVALRHKLPCWNIVCAHQIRPKTTVPTPANLALQAYTSLAAGVRGICWYKFFYYGGAYSYSSFDSGGRRTGTWLYLQGVNHQLSRLGPVMNRLESTGVFFSEPLPEKSLPPLPGRLIRQVRTTTSPRGFTKLSPPVMLGEFQDQDGKNYAMVVNLSLERSIRFELETAKKDAKLSVFNAVDGSYLPLAEREGHWLPPGQGELIKLE